MKKKYNSPEMEVILFEQEDIIVTSGGGSGEGNGGNGEIDLFK